MKSYNVSIYRVCWSVKSRSEKGSHLENPHRVYRVLFLTSGMSLVGGFLRSTPPGLGPPSIFTLPKFTQHHRHLVFQLFTLSSPAVSKQGVLYSLIKESPQQIYL